MEANIQELNNFTITLGDTVHTVGIDEITPETTLNEYLRNKSFLTGTKVMCREGGCGVCIVVAVIRDPVTKVEMTLAVNSCLVALYSCSGWKIKTIEGIGNSKTGLHPIQKTLAQFNGSQCGFCSPGMVMNMYALYERSGNLTMAEVEDSFGGNLCRCTGYRPILAAFKSLAVDASVENIGTYPKLEDMEDMRLCDREKKDACRELCGGGMVEKGVCYAAVGAAKWYKVYTINEIVRVFNVLLMNEKYMLVAGNTAKGVYKPTEKLQVYIDINDVAALKSYELHNESLDIGGNMTLNQVITLFYKISAENAKFKYLSKLADHLKLVATIPVRNIGTVAGNLITKYNHNEFPSDVFLLLCTVGATMTTVNTMYQRVVVKVIDFLKTDMLKKIIEKITLPALDSSFYLETYKIMPRAQNAHAHVNAGFLIKNPSKISSARIMYGGISPTFNQAIYLEQFLVNRNLFDNTTIQFAMATLDSEMKPVENLPAPSPQYRKSLAKSLFYKFVLSIAPTVSPINKSGGAKLIRPLSKGVQDYETNESLYPLNKPITKIEAQAQTSGEAQYIGDLPDLPNQLFGSFVLAKAVPHSTITNIDTKEALSLKGVVKFFRAGDIPGVNSFTPVSPANAAYTMPEEIFCTGVVRFFDQPLGLIVANSWNLAEEAAKLVKVTYASSTKKVLISTREVLNEGDKSRITENDTLVAKYNGGVTANKVYKGEVVTGSQYHFHMETQCTQAVPTEDGLDIFTSTQYMDYTQKAIGECLAIPHNKINITVRRLGGGFGGKISRNNQIACSASLAAYDLRKPVKITLPLDTNMRVCGKRTPNHGKYEITLDDSGVIQHVDIKYYVDVGAEGGNEDPSFFATEIIQSTYVKDRFTIESNRVKSDIPTTTYTRGPGSADGLCIIEAAMEETALAIGMDPLQFRLKNIERPRNDHLVGYVGEFKTWANLDARKVAIEKFNKENRWIKKGLSVVPMVFEMPLLFYPFTALVSIYNSDGTVAVSHGGIEMGQGVNTKVAQTCAYTLGIKIEDVSVKPSNNLIGANSILSGGSVTSEAACYATLDACRTLKERIESIRVTMPPNTPWIDLIQECNIKSVNLTAVGVFNQKSPGLGNYSIYAVAATEVTVDILTGQHIIDRADVLEDVGTAINPTVDIGQIEGGFVMGCGLWTTEQILYGNNGELLTHNTWDYKPPGAKDIPVEFNVMLPKNSKNPEGVLNSKAVGEPPLCLSCSLPIAIRNAVASARKNADSNVQGWYPIDGPSTIDNTFVNSLHNAQQYVL